MTVLKDVLEFLAGITVGSVVLLVAILVAKLTVWLADKTYRGPES